MKKNRMMRVASALLVAVLLTTCGISGTFAKYTSSATTTDTARVAKWGWGTTTISLDLFSDTYDGTVKSADEKNVIAPGTSQTGTLKWTPADTFAPEVDYTLSFAVEATIPEGIENELTWTLKCGDTTTSYDNFSGLKAALEAYTISGDAAADAVPTVTVEIGWVWTFDGGDDAADTALGNADALAECSVKVTMTATQVN